jgi:hypothetical protein
MTADVLRNLLRHSEILWWGDRFLIETEVSYAVATPGKDLELLLEEMTPTNAKNGTKARAAGAPGNSAGQSG